MARRSKPASRASSASAARRRSRAGVRHGDVPRVDKIVGPGNAYVAAAKALVSRTARSTSTPARARSSSCRRGDPEWIAADLIAQAEHDPTRARSHHDRASAGDAVVARPSRGRCRRQTGPARESLAATAASSSRAPAEAVALANRMRPSTSSSTTSDGGGRGCAGAHLRRRVDGAGGGRLRHRLEPRAADGGAARFRGGLSAADFVRVSRAAAHAAGIRARRPGGDVHAGRRAEGLAAHAAST
jgi:histidinol dehydrogenase